MNRKMPSAIERIEVNDATFSGVVIEPTFINFFYGNNGTGKSTIARAIAGDSGIAWHDGKSVSDYTVLVYNQEFVAANFQDYDNLRGVFTVGEANIEIQNQVDEKTVRKQEQDAIRSDAMAEKAQKEIEEGALLSSFQDDCWNKSKIFRGDFAEAITGYKNKVLFAERVLGLHAPANTGLPDRASLKTLYETAFDANARDYQEFQSLGDVTAYKESPGYSLLSKQITSSSDTDFSRFIKALNATDWVSQGYEQFKDTSGKCPYCQQELPTGFEDDLAACFDAQYQEDINELRKFYGDYRSSMQGQVEILKNNLQDLYPKTNIKEYETKLALLEKLIEGNLQKIAEKGKEPSTIAALDETDIERLVEEINSLITEFNAAIRENNDVANAKPQKQAECKTKVWELIAGTLQGEASAYSTSARNLQAEIATLASTITTVQHSSRTLTSEIADLNKRIVSTAPTIKSINDLLRDAGFQGFHLREKEGHPSVYEVVRHDGNIADNLSEGEHNFIAFLYFYHLVRGSHTDADISKDKIVIVDDPVSSMDSSALFIISTLVREMVEVCHNNTDYLDNQVEGDYIKQIFVLTHNVYFHREIAYNQTHRYKCVSFFVVNKVSNSSSVRLCIRQSQRIPTEEENFNPVQNSYAALWGEYREVDTAIPVLNVIRRILEYYFMQLCGYEGVDIRRRVLEDNREKFVEPVEGGLPDYTKYHLATAMLSYISATSVGFSDGLNYVDDCADITLYRSVFELIFEALQQEQHFKMMMGED
jgi:wobble nucleotide-excising tRNase